MINLQEVIAQVPINVYVVLGCCIAGWLMKKFLPADNKIIPLTLTILGAIIFVMLEGTGIANIIIGAFTGAAATGLHQIFAQFIEGTKDRDETLAECGGLAEDGEISMEKTLPQTLARNDKGGGKQC